ncbi:MAG: alternative ribosome rescue aminoacyl-tRNA hydrolase ArfB [Solirubrobacterales bacterium]
MADELRINDQLSIPLSEIEMRASRSSGPGGQHANVTASRVEAVFDVESSQALSDEQRFRLLNRVGTRVDAVAQDARGQARNRRLALERLADKIAAGLEIQAKRRPTRPGRGAKERRLEQKRRRSRQKRQRGKPSLDD